MFWWLRLWNIREHGSRRVVRWSRTVMFRRAGNVRNKNSWGPNTPIKQGAKLVATCEDVREDRPAEVKLALTPPPPPESGDASSASLFPDQALPPREKRILSLLKADEATHIDELVERLENAQGCPRSLGISS
jgi:DNA processing protein